MELIDDKGTICCEDCGNEIIIDKNDITNGEVISCSTCGLEYEVTITPEHIVIKQLTLEGEDWGE